MVDMSGLSGQGVDEVDRNGRGQERKIETKISLLSRLSIYVHFLSIIVHFCPFVLLSRLPLYL
jgi:hypothetical protein